MKILRKNKEGLKISLNGYMYVRKATKSSVEIDGSAACEIPENARKLLLRIWRFVDC